MPSSSVPTISPGEMQILVSRAGLVLNPGQVADLVLAWRQVAGLIAALPHDRPLVDDLAFSFRLAPPIPVPAPKRPARAAAKPKQAARRRTPVKSKQRGTAKKPRGSATRRR